MVWSMKEGEKDEGDEGVRGEISNEPLDEEDDSLLLKIKIVNRNYKLMNCHRDKRLRHSVDQIGCNSNSFLILRFDDLGLDR
jgi:hypothetical protein